MKRLCAAAALALAAASVVPAPASAQYYYRRGWSPGAAAAVGVLGGVAVGAAIAANARPARVYVAPPPEEDCVVERRRVWVPGYGWEWRRRTVCE
jgi:hypothetical protein